MVDVFVWRQEKRKKKEMRQRKLLVTCKEVSKFEKLFSNEKYKQILEKEGFTLTFSEEGEKLEDEYQVAFGDPIHLSKFLSKKREKL